MKKLTCNEAKRMVQPFLKGELKDRDLRAFLNHIRGCKSCQDELETYFIVDYALRYLDNEKNNSYDMKVLLETMISQEEHDLRMREIIRILMTAAVLAMGVLVILAVLGAPVPEPVLEIGRKLKKFAGLIRSEL